VRAWSTSEIEGGISLLLGIGCVKSRAARVWCRRVKSWRQQQ